MTPDRTLSMMEYEDWRQRCGICGATVDCHHEHQMLTTPWANLIARSFGPESTALAQAQQNAGPQQYPPGSFRPMTAEEMSEFQMNGQAGATSWLDSLLGPGLL